MRNTQAVKAEAAGLIIIKEYRNARFELTDKREKSGQCAWCRYVLAGDGEELRRQLVQGKAELARPQNDTELERLLEQSMRMFYQGHGEPDDDFDPSNELYALANHWCEYGSGRLKVDVTAEKFEAFPLERVYEPILAQTSLEAPGVSLVFYLLLTSDPLRGPIQALMELNVRGGARRYFSRVLRDYPRLLSDLFEWSGMLEFENPVGLDAKIKRGAPLIDYLKAYFAQGKDDEEHFMISFGAYDNTTQHNIRRALVVLLALYDAVSAAEGEEHDADRLLTHHATIIRSRVKAKRASGVKRSDKVIR